MQKRAVSASVKGLSAFQIYLLISMSFAFAFILGQDIESVSAEEITGYPSGNSFVQSNSGSSVLDTNTGKIISGIGVGNTYLKQGANWVTNTLGGTKEVVTANLPATGTGLRLAEATNLAGQQGVTSVTGYTGVKIPIPGVKDGFTIPFTQNLVVANLVTNVGHALLWSGLANMAARLFGANNEQAAAIGNAVGAGVFAAKTLTAFFGKGGLFAKAAAGNPFLSSLGAYANPIGIAIAVIVFVLTYKKTRQEVVTFQCLPWEPPLGGSKCEECNKDPLKPCSEYRCRALGQGCQLLNANTERPQCAWISKGDTTSPTITQWNEALRPTNLQYTPDTALRPGARGVKIVSPEAGGCLPAFTALQFGVTTNEPAQCKIDYNRSISFDNMAFYFGDSNYYEYNHTQKLRLPDPNSVDNDLSPVLQNDGTFAFFVRCRDGNGNVNVDEFSINFCVAAGPDTTPPIIEGSSLSDGSAVQHGADNVPIEIYTNEPAQCRWSINDKAYKDMENSLSCATDASQINADLQFTCAGSLTGVQNKQSNDFYFRCEDQPTMPENERNTMTQSYKVSLRGTEPLSLLKLTPNATTITASTSSVPVILTAETDDGADSGVAVCYFSSTGEAGSFVEYYETNSIQHSQQLSLTTGDYTYYTRCIDAGGNSASGEVSFSIAVDKNMPVVTRVYKVGTDSLQLVTNEAAECYYSRTSCNYVTAEGLKFNYPSASQNKLHLAAWKDNSPYYIKCRDAYGNEPSPNACSIIVSGVDLSVKAVA